MTASISVQIDSPYKHCSFSSDQTDPPNLNKLIQQTAVKIFHKIEHVWGYINDGRKLTKQVLKTVINGCSQSARYLNPVIDSIKVLSIITVPFVFVSIGKQTYYSLYSFSVQDIEGCSLALVILSKNL